MEIKKEMQDLIAGSTIRRLRVGDSRNTKVDLMFGCISRGIKPRTWEMTKQPSL